MPSKHIQEPTWEKVKEQFIHAIVTTKAGFKETEILNLLILKGIENITDEDYIRAASQKPKCDSGNTVKTVEQEEQNAKI